MIGGRPLRRGAPVLACLAALFLSLAGAARATEPTECGVDGGPFATAFPLDHVKKAIADKSLSILVVGAGSSQLPGPNGPANSYPARLKQALALKLPGVRVTVKTDVKSRRTAADMVKTLSAELAVARPALMLWQTATVDAMQAVDPDQFSHALDNGIRKARAAGADVMFINPQYSPRTESMIALGVYVENMRWVAVQQEVPVFDRFGLMKAWSDQGMFDLYSATKKLDMAEQVHNCVGRLLADLIIEAAKPDEPAADKK